jgi:hypothetical protein
MQEDSHFGPGYMEFLSDYDMNKGDKFMLKLDESPERFRILPECTMGFPKHRVQGMYLIYFLDSQSCFSLHFLSLHSVAVIAFFSCFLFMILCFFYTTRRSNP